MDLGKVLGIKGATTLYPSATRDASNGQITMTSSSRGDGYHHDDDDDDEEEEDEAKEEEGHLMGYDIRAWIWSEFCTLI